MTKRSTRMHRAIGIAALAVVVAGPLSGCGGSAPSAPATVTLTAPQSADPSIPPTDGPLDATPIDNGQLPPTGSILGPDATGKPLTLADFFEPGSTWIENRFDIADRRQVQGIETDTLVCSRDNAPELELRLANNFKTLQFEVGQSNDSKASDQILIVAVMGNNSQIDVQRLPFNTVQKMTIPVANVNALQIFFYLDDQKTSCGQGSVSSVMFNAVLS